MHYNSTWNDELNAAAKEGDLHTITKIGEYAHVAVGGSCALRLAARGNHFAVVEYLLQFSSRTETTAALLEAIAFEHIEMVRFLLPRSSPKLNKSEALRYAVASKNQTIIDMIFPKSNPEAALQEIFKKDGLSDQYCRLEHLMQQRNAVKINKKLRPESAGNGAVRVRKI